MHLNIAVWGTEQVLVVVWDWAAKEVWAVAEAWGAEEVQVPAGTGHNVMLNADWTSEIQNFNRAEELSEPIRWETD